MTPSSKHPKITTFLDSTTRKLFGSPRTAAISQDTCVFCGKPATDFNDELSAKEFTISGLCQSCQDTIFGKDDV